MKIYLHIGTENTGTTSIQNFLSINRKNLIKKGIYYPKFDSPNHISLPIYASDNYENIVELLIYKNIDSHTFTDFKKEFEKTFVDEINNIPKEIDTIILSDEHCSSRLINEKEISYLKGLFEKISKEIKIIVYIRRQDEFLLTHYNVNVKFGNTQSFEDFCQIRLNNYISGYLNHLNLINKWAFIFGKENIIIKTFEKEKLYNKSIIDDFMMIFGVDAISDFDKCQDLNISLKPKVREFLRFLNKYIEIYKENKLNPVREKIYKIIEKLELDDNYIKENPKSLEKFYKLFEDSNKQIAREYFNRENLFANKTNAYNLDEPEKHFELDLNSAFEIFSKILIEYDNVLNLKINELNKKNEKLNQVREQNNHIISSKSWMITKPLRNIFNLLRNLKQ